MLVSQICGTGFAANMTDGLHIIKINGNREWHFLVELKLTAAHIVLSKDSRRGFVSRF